MHDGPGIRTTVFFKGCSLRCVWCHNPESFIKDIQVTFDKEKCIGCDVCNGIRDISTADICPTNAIEKIGYEITVNELFSEIMKEKEYYSTSNGGVTFSGGEPLVQSEFLYKILKKCKNSGIHTVVDTCGQASNDKFMKINNFVDIYLYDLKLIDSSIHKKYTGSGNKLILENLKFLSENKKRIFIRFPLIPEITDTEANITDTLNFLRDIDIEQVNLLSYHDYAKNKYIKLGIVNDFNIFGKVSQERPEEIKKKFIAAGFKTVIGG